MIKYTNDQEKAANSLLAWYRAPVRQEEDFLYLIDGAAGTGKTTVAKHVIQALNIPKSSIAVTAPTHQAKKVIQKATDFPASTIQSLLGLRPNVEMDKFDIKNPQFDPLAKEFIKFYRVIIIDEASMLNKDSFDLILDKAVQHKVRIIFLGDSYQLPPVGERISKVFTAVPNKSTLREVVRQSHDNPNTDFLLSIREDIEKDNDTNLLKYAVETNMIGDKGYKGLNNVDFGQELLNYLGSTLAEEDINHMRLVTWTNKSVIKWCEALRRVLLKDKHENLINVGETLLSYNTIQDRKREEITLQNSELYKIIDIQETESPYDIKGYMVEIKDQEDYLNKHFIVGADDFDKFRDLAFEKWSDARNAPFYERKKKWGMFFSFKNSHLVLQDSYYKGMPIKKDLYYSYGMTVHKSQGSTFTNTAINLRDILRNPIMSERLRLAYVALSRCRNANIILSK